MSFFFLASANLFECRTEKGIIIVFFVKKEEKKKTLKGVKKEYLSKFSSFFEYGSLCVGISSFTFMRYENICIYVSRNILFLKRAYIYLSFFLYVLFNIKLFFCCIVASFFFVCDLLLF